LISGSLTILEPPGPVQACNGIALRFTVFKKKVQSTKAEFCKVFFVWVGKLSPIKAERHAEIIQAQGAAEDIWADKDESNRKMKEITHCEHTHSYYLDDKTTG
jgi:hypothetical protein